MVVLDHLDQARQEVVSGHLALEFEEDASAHWQDSQEVGCSEVGPDSCAEVVQRLVWDLV